MNTIYIIFIVIILFSFILGLFVTFFKYQKDIKLHKYNNDSLKNDNYEYAKDYVFGTKEYNFSDQICVNKELEKIDLNIEDNVNDNTLVIPIITEDSELSESDLYENDTGDLSSAIMYAIVDDDII